MVDYEKRLDFLTPEQHTLVLFCKIKDSQIKTFLRMIAKGYGLTPFILNALIDFGYEIEYSETLRMMPNSQTGEMEETYILSDFYLKREFDDSELRLIIDSLISSKHIPYNQRKRLLSKI